MFPFLDQELHLSFCLSFSFYPIYISFYYLFLFLVSPLFLFSLSLSSLSSLSILYFSLYVSAPVSGSLLTEISDLFSRQTAGIWFHQGRLNLGWRGTRRTQFCLKINTMAPSVPTVHLEQRDIGDLTSRG